MNHAVDIRTTRPRLRDGIRFIARIGRDGKAWFRIEDDLRTRFHRVGLAEYEFLLALDGQRTIEEARQHAAATTGQQHVLSPEQSESLLLWAEGEALIAGHQVPRQTQDSNGRSSLAWIKLPLFTSNADWQWLVQSTSWLFNIRSIWAALVLWIVAGYIVITDVDRFAADLSAIFAQGSWLRLTAVWLALKVLHELGHLVCCKRYGGRVGEVGVAWMLLAPVAYVDLTDLYRMRSRVHRVLTCLAGIHIELSVAALAVLAWSQATSPSLCHLLVTIAATASAGSLLFNLNPLMRLDGYYALCDWIGRPNLAGEGTKAMQSFVARLFLGCRETREGKSICLAMYGAAAFAYRIMVSVGLVTAANAMYGRLGLLVIVVVMAIVALPAIVRFTSSLLREFQSRPAVIVRLAIATTIIAASIGVGWQVIDSWQSGWSGIVEYGDDSPIRCVSAGKVTRVFVQSGQQVREGDALIELENLAVTADRAKAEFELASGQSRWKRLRELHLLAEAASEQKSNSAIEIRLGHLKRQEKSLVLHAPRAGTVIVWEPSGWIGQWFEEGDALLYVVDETKKKVIVAVRQDASEELVGIDGKQVQFRGDNRFEITGTVTSVTRQAELAPPHPAMAASAGGPLGVRPDNEKGSVTLLSPHLRLEAEISDFSNRLFPGQTLILNSNR